MRKTYFYILLWLNICLMVTKMATAQTSIEFKVDPAQSSFTATMSSSVNFVLNFSDTDSATSSIIGTIQVEIMPSSSPFCHVHVTDMILTNAEDMNLKNELGTFGSIEVDADSASLSLIIISADSSATITGSTFTQPLNEMSLKGGVDLSGSGTLGLFAFALNTVLNEQLGAVVTGGELSGMITQENVMLRLEIPINIFFPSAEFNQGGIVGNIDFGISGIAVATAEIPPNRAPTVSRLPTVTFPEDSQYFLALDEFVTDVDNCVEEMIWSAVILDGGTTGSTKSTGVNASSANDLAVTVNNQSRTATFRGSENYFTTTPVQVAFTATDPGGLSNSDTVEVSITAVNDAPVVSGLPDVTFPEDDSFTLSLDSLSSDIDNSPAEMTWSAVVLDGGTTGSTKSAIVNVSSANNLMVTVDNQSRSVTFHGTDNYFTTTPVQVTLTATDPGGLSNSDTVDVTITAVNDAPGSFTRLLPTDGSAIAVDAVTFSWSTATDVDGDTVSYSLNIKISGIDTIFATTDTTHMVDFGALGLADQTYGVSWSVTASDGQVTIAASNGTGTLDVITGVEDEELASIPEEFALHQNYPNPFNPETTIRYQLPESANVLLRIYNLHGQLVRTLVIENKDTGFHKIVWDARDEAGKDVSSGIYLYRIQASNFVEVKKMMLLR